jgi:hypothetical protein
MIQTNYSTLTLDEWFILNKEGIAFETIKETICKALFVNPKFLDKDTKVERIAEARKLVFYYAHCLYPTTELKAFKAIVNRHRSSIYNNIKTVQDLLDVKDSQLLNFIEDVQFQFNNPTLSHEKI